MSEAPKFQASIKVNEARTLRMTECLALFRQGAAGGGVKCTGCAPLLAGASTLLPALVPSQGFSMKVSVSSKVNCKRRATKWKGDEGLIVLGDPPARDGGGRRPRGVQPGCVGGSVALLPPTLPCVVGHSKSGWFGSMPGPAVMIE